MLSFLFEQYGYYPVEFKEGTFYVNDWEFRLLEIEFDEQYMYKIDQYCQIIRDQFGSKGPFIIKTRTGEKTSNHDGKTYSLISAKRGFFNLNELNKFHVFFREEDRAVDLNKILSSWESRSSELENYGISSLRIDGNFYEENLEATMFAFGMSQNAQQYLSDAIKDYGDEIKDVTIAHKRIKDLNNFDFFNPFNFIVDHPIRDIVELYRTGTLSFDYMLDLLEYYQMDPKKASLFIARLMYPIQVFDLLEENMEKKEKNLKFNFVIEKEILKIKKVYEYFKEKYHIRPIVWLE